MKQNQCGYLMFAALLLIFLMGILSISITYVLSDSAKSNVTTLLSEQAFYIAESGLNRATRSWYTKAVTCANITGNAGLTAASVGNGQFTVTGSPVTNSTTLSAAITSNATTIPLTSASGFPSSGAITIGTEGIYYSGLSGNNLTGAIRGAGSTSAAAQSKGAAVTQNECILTSTGGVPNLTSPLAKRTIQSIVFSFPASSSSIISPIMAIGSVDFSSSSLENDHSCFTCSSYPGSTIQTNSKSNKFTSFSTSVDANAADGGKLATSSYPGSIKADIMEGTNYTKSSLWSTYFTQTRSYIQSNADYVGTNVNGLKGIVIYADGNVSLSKGNLGTAADPVVLYVRGNLSLSNVSAYGIIYATGSVTMNSLSFTGTVASENNVQISSASVVYDYNLIKNMTTDPTFTGILNAASVNGGSGVTPNPDYANMQESVS